MVLLRRIDMMTSTGSREGSGRRMKEVACPTCTVRLQVRFLITHLSLYVFRVLYFLEQVKHGGPHRYNHLCQCV